MLLILFNRSWYLIKLNHQKLLMFLGFQQNLVYLEDIILIIIPYH